MPNTFVKFATLEEASRRKLLFEGTSFAAIDYYKLQGLSPEAALELASNGQATPNIYEVKESLDHANSGEYTHTIGLINKGTEMETAPQNESKYVVTKVQDTHGVVVRVNLHSPLGELIDYGQAEDCADLKGKAGLLNDETQPLYERIAQLENTAKKVLSLLESISFANQKDLEAMQVLRQVLSKEAQS